MDGDEGSSELPRYVEGGPIAGVASPTTSALRSPLFDRTEDHVPGLPCMREAQHVLVFELDGAVPLAGRRRGLRFVLARPSVTSPEWMAWLAWRPSGNDTVTWSETYGVFASAAPLNAGKPLVIAADLYPARGGGVYVFDGKTFTESAAGGVAPDRYGVRNASAAAYAFGLMQTPKLNGVGIVAPVSIALLAGGGAIEFAVSPSVDVSIVENGRPALLATVPLGVSATRRRFRYVPDRRCLIHLTTLGERTDG